MTHRGEEGAEVQGVEEVLEGGGGGRAEWAHNGQVVFVRMQST